MRNRMRHERRSGVVLVSRCPIHWRLTPWDARLGLAVAALAGLLSAACFPLSEPDPPGEVWLSSTEVGVHNLNWSPAPRAEYYKVYYPERIPQSALDPGPDIKWVMLAERVTGTAYVDTAGTALSYSVVACNWIGCHTGEGSLPRAAVARGVCKGGMDLSQGHGCRTGGESPSEFSVNGDCLASRQADGSGAGRTCGIHADISPGLTAFRVYPGRWILSGCKIYGELFSPVGPRTQTDDEELVRCLVGEGTDLQVIGLMEAPLLKMAYGEGRLLEMAYRSGDAQFLQDLIDRGVDVEAVGDDGQTVLYQAIRAKDLAGVRLLVGAGANVNGTGPSGETVLRQAIRAGDTNIVRLLLDAGADIEGTPPLITDALGNPEMLSLLIEWGADLNYRNYAGESVLFEAIRSGNTESVMVLLDSGAVLESQDESVDSLLEVAARSSTPEMARLFITVGGDVNSADRRGRPMLFTAIESAHPEMVRLFLEAGADPDAMDTLGDTALMAAAEEPNPEAVRRLLEAGTDPNTTTVYRGNFNNFELTIYGSSPLLSAIMIPWSLTHGIRYDAEAVAEDEENRLPTVQVLLDAGIDPWAANGSDYSICEFVADYHSIERRTGTLISLRVREALLDHCRATLDKRSR